MVSLLSYNFTWKLYTLPALKLSTLFHSIVNTRSGVVPVTWYFILPLSRICRSWPNGEITL